MRPRQNKKYWEAKIAHNQMRDEQNMEKLSAAGWILVRVWEHENPALAAGKIEKLVRSRLRVSAGR
jgi:DNA mismatch endonuclease (patch repair protein)